ncbi:ABC transporter permease [Dactylosporangium sp. AC04546]|uniref:ABC transporter permease n=1 Tax=Dactylosporangium sp. AC04546 TaxID=2862460 RepID=UPI001EDF2949|nr:ABC transporter permease [Dactylosporangium sp. AC04546]WVK89236.1 ABC transporter permease [Dactylosporangium sp. AC04546]
MIDIVRAEWTKLRTSPGTLALLVGVVVATVGVSMAASACSGNGCGADLPKLGLTGVQLGQAVVAILGVLVIGHEYGTGMVRVTLTAMPRRLHVLAVKAAVLAAVVAAAAVPAVAGAVAVSQLMLPDHDLVLRPAIGSVLYLVLVGLLAMGTATALRSAAAAIGTILALLYALPIVLAVISDEEWRDRLRRMGPSTAGLAVQATTADAVTGPWKGLGVLALWALGALLVGAVVLHRRDA